MWAQQQRYRSVTLTDAHIKAGLIQCDSCDAIFNPKTQWIRVTSPKGDTSGRHSYHSIVPDKCCPICNTKFE